MANIGGYDTNSYSEDTSVTLLTEILQEKHPDRGYLFKCHFAAGDKGPNFDGHFELLKNEPKKAVPCATFSVQIKSMTRDYVNNNQKEHVSQYKYSCESKAINSAIERITLNPVFIFLVDVTDKRVFYKLCSSEFLKLYKGREDQASVTIYFNDTDQLTDIVRFSDFCAEAYTKQKNPLAVDILDEKLFIFSLHVDRWQNVSQETTERLKKGLRRIKYYTDGCVNRDIISLSDETKGLFLLVVEPWVIEGINKYIAYVDEAEEDQLSLRQRCLGFKEDTRAALSNLRIQWAENIYLYIFEEEDSIIANKISKELIRALAPPCNTEMPEEKLVYSDVERKPWR